MVMKFFLHLMKLPSSLLLPYQKKLMLFNAMQLFIKLPLRLMIPIVPLAFGADFTVQTTTAKVPTYQYHLAVTGSCLQSTETPKAYGRFRYKTTRRGKASGMDGFFSMGSRFSEPAPVRHPTQPALSEMFTSSDTASSHGFGLHVRKQMLNNVSQQLSQMRLTYTH